jgi:hypothetical protein
MVGELDDRLRMILSCSGYENPSSLESISKEDVTSIEDYVRANFESLVHKNKLIPETVEIDPERPADFHFTSGEIRSIVKIGKIVGEVNVKEFLTKKQRKSLQICHGTDLIFETVKRVLVKKGHTEASQNFSKENINLMDSFATIQCPYCDNDPIKVIWRQNKHTQTWLVGNFINHFETFHTNTTEPDKRKRLRKRKSDVCVDENTPKKVCDVAQDPPTQEQDSIENTNVLITIVDENFTPVGQVQADEILDAAQFSTSTATTDEPKNSE